MKLTQLKTKSAQINEICKEYWQLDKLVLVCGHGNPRSIKFKQNKAYCRHCQKWLDIDFEKSKVAIEKYEHSRKMRRGL